MGVYICQKCGAIENTAVGGYWKNKRNREIPKCSECNTGKWHSVFPKKYWTDYGKKLLELERLNDGSMMNATEYLKSIGKI